VKIELKREKGFPLFGLSNASPTSLAWTSRVAKTSVLSSIKNLILYGRVPVAPKHMPGHFA